MKIEQVDFFYLSMPFIREIGDGSQDALVVRVRAGGLTGWGECEAAPLVSIAAWNCPMSHSACKPVSASVLGQSLDSKDDIERINALVRENSFDLLQADHTLSGIDIALWDLLGKKRSEPVYRLLGYPRAYPKVAYASQLFGAHPEETLHKARRVRRGGYRAAKFGWGSYGRGSVKEDEDQVHAAREGLGEEGILLIDAGTVWGDRVETAALRLPALQEVHVHCLEEPFVSGALQAYRDLAGLNGSVHLAGGEGCHNFHQAINMIDFAGLGFVQIDTGRIGGITPARRAAEYADSKGVTYVNHTFTTHLALSASLQPYAGMQKHELCEYPVEASLLATELTITRLTPDQEGRIVLPESPGLGIEPDAQALKKYLVEAEIRVADKTIFRTPEI